MPLNKVIISGGGTGGHIFPAVAIGNELKRLYPTIEILFVGALGRMEMEKVPAAGFKIVGLPITGIQRSFSISNIFVPFKLITSILKAKKIIQAFKPDIVIGVGGYASAAILYAASSKSIPCLIQEQNSYAGLTNKWLSKKVNTICVAYQGMEKFFPKEKIMITGNPVRAAIADASGINQKSAKDRLGFDSALPMVLVIGGSQGSRMINQSIQSKLVLFEENNCQLLWQTGQLFSPDTQSIKGIQALPFIGDMATAYAAADIVISRAGATSISELSLLGKSCILVPLPSAAEDHQTENAMALVNNSAALLIRDSEANDKLVATAIELLKNKKLQLELSENITHFAQPNALVNIVDQIRKLTQ
ncbi:MAG: undecaprenyldiphospho-muramoylpentapeptide beta-N-acetylglucosaminyltransferase [bacterium]|nr:undecaprenyldiphospho-muramoylpentapeptide beta-N-acetylglucosaminyltransferase [bacterium]